MRPVWIFCAVCMGLPSLSACHPSPPSVAPASERPSLAALAERIAPGAPAPRSLVAGLPEPIRREVAARAPKGLSDGAMLDEARARMKRYSVNVGEPATTLPVIEAFSLAEAVALRPGPAQLEASMLLVQMDESARLTASMLLGLGGMLRGVVAGAAPPSDPTMPFWEAIQRDGASHQAAFAGAVLRGSPSDAQAIAVLRSMARSLPRDAAPPRELRRVLFEDVAVREGAQASVDTWLDVAASRLLVDDTAGTRKALDRSAQAVASTDKVAAASSATRRGEIVAELERIEAIASLASSTSPDDRLRRASLQIAAGRPSAAREAYEQLRRDLPRDARPVVGLARVRLAEARGESTFDVYASVHGDLRAAAGFDHLDGDYYGLRIGLTGVEAARLIGQARDEKQLAEQAVALLTALETLNREYVRFAPERSAVLGFVLQTVRTEMGIGLGTPGFEKRLQDHCENGVALAARYPGTGDAFRLSLGCASLIDPSRAFDVALRPLPEALRKDSALVELQARVLVGLIARRRAFDRIPTVRAIIEALPTGNDHQTTERESLLADLTMLSVLDGKGSWQDAADAYQRARSITATSDSWRLSNNLGIALSGTLSSPLNQVVVDHLKRSVSLARSSSDQAARANLAALALINGSSSDALDLVLPLVKDAANPPVIARLQTIAAATKVGQNELARAQATATLEALRPDNESYGGFGQKPFVWALGNFNFSLSVAVDDSSYAMKLGGYYDTLLMLPTSVRYPDVVALAKPAESPKKR